MLLNPEELLAVLNGDVEPDRLADLLDRLEHCPESNAALQALVALRANREEGLAALRRAAEVESPMPQPILHPSARRSANPSAGWGTHLRLAASIALVAIAGIWGTTAFLDNASVTELATRDYEDFFTVETPRLVEPTADAVPSITDAADRMANGRYAEAFALLEQLPQDSEGYVSMYRGMSKYFLYEYDEALHEFAQLGEEAERGPRHQAGWYKANALLALDRPFEAVIVLGQLRNDDGDYPFVHEAAAAYEAVCDAMGVRINCAAGGD